MFHSPVSIDVERQDPDLPTETAELQSFDAGNERLREAHLHNGQVKARALFAPYFAITALAAEQGWTIESEFPSGRLSCAP